MAAREEIVDEVRAMLVGPGFGVPDPDKGFECELIENRLSLAYMMGILYPKATAERPDIGSDEEPEVDDEATDPDDPLSMANSILPASMGLSICVSADAIVEIYPRGAVYDEHERIEGRERRWKRRPLETVVERVGAGGLRRKPTLEGHAEIEVLDRGLADGSRLLTISLSNTEESEGRPDITKALFQVSLECRPVEGSILPYPSTRYVPPSDEERELRIIYGDQRPFASGHGTATDWTLLDGACVLVRTESLPRAHVWRPLFDRLEVVANGTAKVFSDPSVFDLHRLASGELGAVELGQRLSDLLALYSEWIDAQAEVPVEVSLQIDGARIVERCRASLSRMQAGLELLRTNSIAHRAFTLANRAMLMSMCHAARANGAGRRDGLQGPFPLGTAETAPINYFANTTARWRPFQLAFFLQILPSLFETEHEDRGLVDVIWFATGGGKTEAYLLAAAFELIRRRLVEGAKGGGIGVLNRYTFRFLTADQFQRTAGMVCALEVLRQELADGGDNSLGSEEFSIGLFVGGEVSPNKFVTTSMSTGAHEQYMELLEAREPRSVNPFPIESCPSCGTLLVPNERQIKPDGTPDVSFYGFRASANDFMTFCPDEDCAFHSGLPIHFVDEMVYKKLPSFLLGTIDKFAMVPWNEKGGRLFGVGTNRLPPSLVIQDELHLISGPLGTLAGIYEAAFETVMSSVDGHRPKVIASSATIRNATAQCRRIYGRRTAVFPSPGIRADDSFFSKLDVGNEARSRLYVGVMGQGVRSTIAVSWTMAAMLQVVHALGREGKLDDREIDAFWTLVAYHNSKRELGRIANATRDEIPTRLKVYAKAEANERQTRFQVLELKAHSEVPVPQARQMLRRHHTAQVPAVDIAPCTSIISVGIDIDRLGLMLVNGQPKLTAEYIQATSRVGRGAVPGIVVTCYSPSKPRDRSHYESFRDYHEKFYSFVEPTSVTPGAIPAIERALHAALVTVVRHGAGLGKNFQAANFDPAIAATASRIEALLFRLRQAYDAPEENEERERLATALEERVECWKQWAEEGRRSGGLGYVVAPKQSFPALLVRFGDQKRNNVGWHTLQSMRHVDREITMEG
ncbi:hypothetical protein [Mesorhizobium sp. M0909]|uniref:hypothetical protein n=1 Tax=Mesorhizobium sp. M0909 TaxID=2957024 RepID=UPI00333A3C93